MDIYRLGDMVDHKTLLRELGVHGGGISIMSDKMELYYFYIRDLPTPAANILKQDALSIGAELFLDENSYRIEIMGIINANSDSFYSGSRFIDSEAISAIEDMIESGATIIDIGAVSSRPNADIVSLEEEMSRIRPICDTISSMKLHEYQ